jgi:hypothetical protein
MRNEQSSRGVDAWMEERPLPGAPVSERSVGAMMRRSTSLAESHLILGASRYGSPLWDGPAGR